MKRSWIGRVLIGSLLVWSLLVGFVHGQAVVVTTTMLESAVRALVGDTIQVVRLLPPGSCPGHFDLEPNQLRGLSEARVVVRHHFQASMDATLLKSGLLRERIAVVETAEPMTIPSQYAKAAVFLARRLTTAFPEQASSIGLRLGVLREMARLREDKIRDRCARLSGRKVISAVHQVDFCSWLGLEVVGVFESGAEESARNLGRVVALARAGGAELVVGNLQWGTRHLEALSENTGLPGAMLSSFPVTGRPDAYWDLVERNVAALLRGMP